MLLQGERGFSRKGSDDSLASHYYTHPHLQLSGALTVQGHSHKVTGSSAWFDHEWSSTLLEPQAQGWDWSGINLTNGGALTMFQDSRCQGCATLDVIDATRSVGVLCSRG